MLTCLQKVLHIASLTGNTASVQNLVVNDTMLCATEELDVKYETEKQEMQIATQAVLDGEIQERTRLARDLHDRLGSMLTEARMSIESLKNEEIQYIHESKK